MTSNNLNDFFDSYAQALSIYDTKGMAVHYDWPCTFISNEKTTVFNEQSQLEGLFNQGISFYKHYGITDAQAELRHKRHLTDRICNVKLRWKYHNTDGHLLYDCDYEYLLKLDKHSKWKIEIAVSLNEKERMEEWLKVKEMHHLVIS